MNKRTNRPAVQLAAALICGFLGAAIHHHLFARMAVAQAPFKQFINPGGMNYTEGVAVNLDGARMVFVSGQVGSENGVVGETLAEQADIAFASLQKELEAAGFSIQDVVKLNVYIKNLDLERARIVDAAKSKYFTHADQPAATWIGVTSLILAPFEIEVEAIALRKV